MGTEKNEQFPEEVKDFVIGDGRNTLLIGKRLKTRRMS